MSDSILAGIQTHLDNQGEGWRVAHYVISVGVERIVNGELETGDWTWSPSRQPGYVTRGLVDVLTEELINEDTD